MSIDFEALRDRLHTSFERGVEDADEARAATVLHSRRQTLAARQLHGSERDALASVMVAAREGTHLGVPLARAEEVREVEVSVLPGTGRFVNGVFQVRGRCSGLVDLAPFFAPAQPLGHGQHSLVVVVRGGPGELGLRIDEIVDVRTLYTDEVETRLGAAQLDFVRHVTRDGVHVIDVDALMSMPEIRITGSAPR